MAATGGSAAYGEGTTPENDEHFVMESSPYRTANYNLVANGPVWQAMGRPHTVRVLGLVRVHGQRMRWIFVPEDTEGSVMAGHLMLVWSAGSHTYALGFHDLWGLRLNRALDLAVASHLVMVQP
jgi:hypothetical protein